MDLIMAIAKRHNLWVIEDCAQAHLARYKDNTLEPLETPPHFLFTQAKTSAPTVMQAAL